VQGENAQRHILTETPGIVSALENRELFFSGHVHEDYSRYSGSAARIFRQQKSTRPLAECPRSHLSPSDTSQPCLGSLSALPCLTALRAHPDISALNHLHGLLSGRF